MKISFVLPVHNCAEFIHPAIDSCLKQSYDNVEVIVVDDFSTDSLPDYVAWAKKQGFASKVKFLRNEKNLGRSASRNIGNAAATGDIIAVLDADDLSMPKRAELTVARFKAASLPSIGLANNLLIHGGAYKTDAVGRDGGLAPTDVFNKEKALETLTAGIIHSTVAYSKELAMRYPYQEGEPARLGVDDFTLFMTMALDGVKFDYIPSALAAYRVNEFGITNTRNAEEVEKFKRGYVEGLLAVAA